MFPFIPLDVSFTPVIVIFVQFPSTEIASDHPADMFVNVQFLIVILLIAFVEEPSINIALAPSSSPRGLLVFILINLQLIMFKFSVLGCIIIPFASFAYKFWNVNPLISTYFVFLINVFFHFHLL